MFTAIIITILTLRSPKWLIRSGDQLRRLPIWPAAVAGFAFILWGIATIQPQTKIFPTVVLLLGVWLLTAHQLPIPIRRSLWIILGLLITMALAAQLYVLLDIPTVHVHDEGAYARMAFDYFRTGMLSGDIYGYPPRHFIGAGSWLVTLAYWFKIVGFGWWSGRLYAFVVSCLALPFIYAAGARYFRSRVAGMAAMGFMAITITFVEVHRVRPDAPTIFLLSICLYFFSLLHQYPEQKRWYFLLTIGANLKSH